MANRVLFLGALLGLIGVAAGAFGAHGLRPILSEKMMIVFETGVRYQMYHSFALLAVALAYTKWPGKGLVISGWMFIVGIILFSGSLYGLCLSGVRSLGMITPIGGLAFLTGWLCMAWSILKK